MKETAEGAAEDDNLDNDVEHGDFQSFGPLPDGSSLVIAEEERKKKHYM